MPGGAQTKAPGGAARRRKFSTVLLCVKGGRVVNRRYR